MNEQIRELMILRQFFLVFFDFSEPQISHLRKGDCPTLSLSNKVQR